MREGGSFSNMVHDLGENVVRNLHVTVPASRRPKPEATGSFIDAILGKYLKIDR